MLTFSKCLIQFDFECFDGRLPRQKHQRKGSATLNDSNKTEENSLLMENITVLIYSVKVSMLRKPSLLQIFKNGFFPISIYIICQFVWYFIAFFVIGIICIPSYFQLFLNEFLNNPSLHERLAENINRTLSIKTTEKRNRKKSGKISKIQENPKPNKPEKSEESTIPEESESNYSQNMESQGLYTFLDDILNINVRRLGLVFLCVCSIQS